MDDCDDYVLTPLAEAEDGPRATEDDDSTVMAAEDYVQSLVTIESNWANGRNSQDDYYIATMTICVAAETRREKGIRRERNEKRKKN